MRTINTAWCGMSREPGVIRGCSNYISPICYRSRSPWCQTKPLAWSIWPPSLCLCSSCPHKNSAFSSVERLVTYKMCPFTQQPLTVGKLIPFCLKAIPVSALNNYYMGGCLVTPVSQVLFREATSLCFMSESRHQERLKIIAKYVCLPCWASRSLAVSFPSVNTMYPQALYFAFINWVGEES